MQADQWHLIATIGLLAAVSVAGCQFPEECESYPGPDDTSSSSAASLGEGASCELVLVYERRTYTMRDGALVTDVGEPIDGFEIRGCRGAEHGGRTSAKDTSALKAFRLGGYCTSDALAVEISEGEQLLVFEVKKRENSVLP